MWNDCLEKSKKATDEQLQEASVIFEDIANVNNGLMSSWGTTCGLSLNSVCGKTHNHADKQAD